jgi:hypothetical protein
MFRHESAISVMFLEQGNTGPIHYVLDSRGLPDDSTPVPKHVGF